MAHAGTDVRPLNALAAEGLAGMLTDDRTLFCHRVLRREGAMIREGESQRYTIMTVLGLHRYAASPERSPIEVKPILERLYGDFAWIESAGDAGLMVWLAALTAPERIGEVVERLRIDRIERFADFQERRTMELSWLLTGLGYAARALPEWRAKFEDLARKIYGHVMGNQGPHGFFGHQAAGSLTGILRRRIGSFADQVYPAYGLTQFARAYESTEALKAARRCADAMCAAQGPLGQWWWHYDAGSGRVVQQYPVYAVHQDGMAPMALFAVGEAAGMDYSPSIYRGLEWIDGRNELQADLRDSSLGVIWRCIYRKRWAVYGREALTVLKPRLQSASPGELRVLSECRPYHLGWLLYAFAERE